MNLNMNPNERAPKFTATFPLEEGNKVRTYVAAQRPGLSIEFVKLQTLTIPAGGAELNLFADDHTYDLEFDGGVQVVRALPPQGGSLELELLLQDSKAEYVHVTSSTGQMRVWMFFEQVGTWSILPWYEARQQEERGRILCDS